MKKLILLLFILAQALPSVSQDDPIKWGKIPDENLQPMTDTTNPGAIILCDYELISYDTYNGKLCIIYDRHRRIKILSKEGYEWANVEIPYDSYFNYERVTAVEAECTYINEQGKKEKHELEKKSIFDEKVYSTHHVVRFSIPAVKEQAVIEYRYKIISKDFYNFKKWYFQSAIPTRHSELVTKIPNYFNYSKVFANPIPLTLREETDYTQNLFLTSDNQYLHSNVETIAGVQSRYTASNVCAATKEPFVSCQTDILPQVVFNLQSINVPGESQTEYESTWDKISEDMSGDKDFGKLLEEDRELDHVARTITQGLTDPREKMIHIYNYVKNTMKWNGDYTKFADGDLDSPFEKKTGTSAEINLLLTTMLKHAGLNVYPVLISTKKHGKVKSAYPMLSQFNHVISYVRIDSSVYFLDAINPNIPYSQVPANDVNGSGFAINDKKPFWVTVTNAKKSSSMANCIFTMDKEGKISGEMQLSADGSFAVKKRDEIGESGKEKYIEKNYVSKIPDINILDKEFQNVDSIELPVKLKMKFETSGFSTNDNDVIYFKPKLLFAMTENPFKAKDRSYPVDFDFPCETTYLLNLTIPDGYELSEVPASLKLTLPDNSIQYLFAATAMGNRLQLMNRFSINQSECAAKDYPDIKEIYTQIVAKEGEQVVLKKKK